MTKKKEKEVEVENTTIEEVLPINQNGEEETIGSIVENDIDTISLDNTPISPLIQSEDEIIPKNFVNIPPQKPTTNENKIKIHNGRVYKDVGNGYGMYADNGETFRIK